MSTIIQRTTRVITRKVEGIQGAAGPTGPTGPQGPQGDTGSQGAQGIQGEPGTSTLYGSGAPSNGLGSDGDFYIDQSASMIYGPKASGSWPAGTSLISAAMNTAMLMFNYYNFR